MTKSLAERTFNDIAEYILLTGVFSCPTVRHPAAEPRRAPLGQRGSGHLHGLQRPHGNSSSHVNIDSTVRYNHYWLSLDRSCMSLICSSKYSQANYVIGIIFCYIYKSGLLVSSP